jgi:hypothetical protein
MKESRWQAGLMITAFCFIVGLLLFLTEVHSTGEAPQRFDITISWSAVSVAGALLVVVAAIGAVVLYLSERRKENQYR